MSKETETKKLKRPEAPEGFVYNADGDLIAMKNIPASELRKDAFVKGLVAQVKEHSNKLKVFKQDIIKAFETFREEMLEQYDTKLHSRGSGENVTAFSFDGKYKITYKTDKLKSLGPEHDAARQLARDYYDSQKNDLPHDVLLAVQDFFVKDASVAQTIKFIGMGFQDPLLLKAQEAAKDALLVIGSKCYFNFYERDEEGAYQQVHLNFSKL
ncbi:DUF3164 family protein [Vibrio sp. YMD68]|uniref:DUF3164 family protein n=1 Tax=Vibrio sp. YMD68 TaxID=3042300 RepID=UPI00249CE734|nr:DUF3164 family protein [Vibrio sp. YMD68]WGV98842.1 DUF3164 family protein [Vibrio sp. YMD68]WGW01231.1 DUF3164 family protein [Vibrio sp. YMD68]